MLDYDFLKDRVLEGANYIVKNRTTVRETAKMLRVSKSTVHHDMIKKLPKINPYLAKEVREILEQNKAERHLRGGISTKRLWERKKESRNLDG
jgi:putative DeoR family transcriptional regulator (stage III sporulation protein D)